MKYEIKYDQSINLKSKLKELEEQLRNEMIKLKLVNVERDFEIEIGEMI